MPTDWTAALHDLTAKAGENYARFVTHSQDLLGRVYRGELTPMTLQEQLPGFLNDRGSKFYGELTRISFDFFNGFMSLNARYAGEYYRGLLPGYVEPEPPETPPDSGPIQDWTRWMQVFQSQMAEQNQRSASGYHRLMEKISKGELSASSVEDYSRRFSRERGADYARDAAELNFRFFEGMIRLNQRFHDDLFFHLTRNGNGASPDDSPSEPVYVELSGAIGSIVSTSLVIENTTGDRSEATFAVSQFRNTDGGGPPFDAPVEVEPGTLSLRADESRAVTVRLHLREDLFTAGRACAATLIVRGQSEQDTLVFLVVKPSAP
jgi:hypothetical protein